MQPEENGQDSAGGAPPVPENSPRAAGPAGPIAPLLDWLSSLQTGLVEARLNRSRLG